MQGRNGAKPSCARRQKREFRREATDLRGGVRVQPAQPSPVWLGTHGEQRWGQKVPTLQGTLPYRPLRHQSLAPGALPSSWRDPSGLGAGGWAKGGQLHQLARLCQVSRASSEDKLSDHMLFRDITVSDLWGPAGWSLGGQYRPPILWWSQSLGLWAAPSWRAASLGPVSLLDWEQLPCPGILQDYSGPVVFALFLY